MKRRGSWNCIDGSFFKDLTKVKEFRYTKNVNQVQNSKKWSVDYPEQHELPI
jgi:hypothetical protein